MLLVVLALLVQCWWRWWPSLWQQLQWCFFWGNSWFSHFHFFCREITANSLVLTLSLFQFKFSLVKLTLSLSQFTLSLALLGNSSILRFRLGFSLTLSQAFQPEGCISRPNHYPQNFSPFFCYLDKLERYIFIVAAKQRFSFSYLLSGQKYGFSQGT